MNKLRDILFTRIPAGSSGTHGVLVMVVGGYILWMAYKMVQNTMTGVSEMSMTTTIILAALMGLAGLFAFGYGAYLFWRGWKKTAEAAQTQELSVDNEPTDSIDEAQEEE